MTADVVTISEAFDVSIAAEETTEKLFRGLAAKFAAFADLRGFWLQYAQEEVQHAHLLRELKLKVRPEQLTAQADPGTVALLRLVAGFSLDDALAGVKDLEDAFVLVRETENGELNAVFSFIMDTFEPDETVRESIRDQLTEHIARLALDTPPAYRDRTRRRAIRAA